MIAVEIVEPVDQDDHEAGPDDARHGFVYLLKSGRHYKIGHTLDVGRRRYDLAIRLPEPVTEEHVIRTDDPRGDRALLALAVRGPPEKRRVVRVDTRRHHGIQETQVHVARGLPTGTFLNTGPCSSAAWLNGHALATTRSCANSVRRKLFDWRQGAWSGRWDTAAEAMEFE